MENVASVIQNQNTNSLKDPVAPTAKEYNCRPTSSNCRLAEKSLSEDLVYHAQVNKSDINETKNYYGICEKNFKECYINHTTSFRNKSKGKSAQLSQYIWKLKNSRICYDLKWSIA